MACGRLVAESLRVNWQALRTRLPESPAIAKMVRLDQLLSQVSGKADDWYGQVCSQMLTTWTVDLAIPRLGEYGIQEADLDKILAGTRNRNNPTTLNRQEIREILAQRL